MSAIFGPRGQRRLFGGPMVGPRRAGVPFTDNAIVVTDGTTDTAIGTYQSRVVGDRVSIRGLTITAQDADSYTVEYTP